MNSSKDDPLPGISRGDFPDDFRWGCATSAYQIEGAVNEDGRGESIWDRFCAAPGNIRDGSSGAVASNHYHQWPEDLKLAHDMGVNSYRFSIAWPRIFPDGLGRRPNGKGIDFYSRLVDGMLEQGIEPWATLYHWDLPQPLQDRGGWNNRDTVLAFVDYAATMSRILGDRIKHWMTHNEPWCTAFIGHLEGVHAPGERNFKTALQVCHHVLLSHGLSVPVIRANAADSRLGIALSLHPLSSATASQADIRAKVRHDGLRNRWFLDPLYGRGYPEDIWNLCGNHVPAVEQGDLKAIAAPTDFLGVNYYFPEIVADAPGEAPIATKVIMPANVERTAYGWEVSPDGLVSLLKRVTADYQPAEIYLTENGSTYDDIVTGKGTIEDFERRSYLARHIAALKRAVDGSIPVKGYFAWSLLDNFEWSEGYLRRFGLIHVDFKTQRRTLKLSGEWYRNFLKNRRVC